MLMENSIDKIYISGALTFAKTEQKNIYEKIADVCQTICADIYVPHLSGTDPNKNPDVSPFDVWKKDHREVAICDLIIAYVGQPSLGVGAELEIARITASNIIIWWFEGEKVSRMAKGNPAIIKQIEAKNEDHLYKQLKDFLNQYAVKNKKNASYIF